MEQINIKHIYRKFWFSKFSEDTFLHLLPVSLAAGGGAYGDVYNGC